MFHLGALVFFIIWILIGPAFAGQGDTSLSGANAAVEQHILSLMLDKGSSLAPLNCSSTPQLSAFLDLSESAMLKWLEEKSLQHMNGPYVPVNKYSPLQHRPNIKYELIHIMSKDINCVHDTLQGNDSILQSSALSALCMPFEERSFSEEKAVEEVSSFMIRANDMRQDVLDEAISCISVYKHRPGLLKFLIAALRDSNRHVQEQIVISLIRKTNRHQEYLHIRKEECRGCSGIVFYEIPELSKKYFETYSDPYEDWEKWYDSLGGKLRWDQEKRLFVWE